MSLTRLIPIYLFCLFLQLNATAQDTIVFENQFPFLVNIIQESEWNVYYQKYGVDTSASYVLEKRFISDLRYENPEDRKQKYKRETVSFGRQVDLWITPMDTVTTIKGLLHRMDDSTLMLQKKTALFEGSKSLPSVIYKLPYERIFRIEVRKRNKVRQYALWGAAIGFVSGTITGLAVFKDTPPCDPVTMDGRDCDESLASPRSSWEKSIMTGFASAGGGFLIGGAIGSVKVKIPISGRKDLFNAAVPRLHRIARMQRE